MKSKLNQSIVNKYKLIYTPLLIVLLASFTISISSFYISKALLLKQVKQDGLNLAKQITKQIEKDKASLDIINEMLKQQIRTAGTIVIKNEKNLSDNFLIELMKDLQLDELHWLNDNGETLYSSIKAYKGWIPFKGHPLYDFIRSKDQELIYDIRPNRKFGIPTKYGAIKNSNGYFVHVGILPDNIQKLTERFNYQILVSELAEEENIIYAIIVDKNLKPIANANKEDFGIIYNALDEINLKEAIKGTIGAKEFFYEEINKKLLEMIFPIFIDGKIIGALVIGHSMESVYSSIYSIFFTSSIISIIIFLAFLWVQNKNIIKPVNQLKLSNKEIVSAYQQLSASNEELRAQYDELQNYASSIDHLAYNDYLTSLPNRRSFLKMLEESINKNQSGAVMLLDLDDFKRINDTLGHTQGDKVLNKVSQYLINIKDEKVFVSRFSGDEFLVLIEGEKDIAKIENYAKKVINILKNKFTIEENVIYIGCSIGITLYPFDSNEVNQLIMNADLALHNAKDLGKNNYIFFKKEMVETLKEQIEIESILRKAITENGFKLLYQPQVCTNTRTIVGFEALLRLKNHSISPSVFIPVAEKNGMIVEIGRWVTKEVINQISIWKNNGIDVKPIAINFSAKQLDDLNYIIFLEKALKKRNLDGKYIEIEITESIFLDKKEKTITFLNKLKSLGIKIALDDFGTKYSSLSYLTFLPVDKIKLDKSLCDKFLEMESFSVMNNIISLAHTLNLEVLAEGVEYLDQYKHLKAGGCNYIQGYLFSEPVEAVEVEKIYKTVFLKKGANS